MSLSPDKRPTSDPNCNARDPSGHYVYQPASAACTQRIIDEGLKQTSSINSFTSTRPSPTLSVRSLNLSSSGGAQNANPSDGDGGRGSVGSYKQALADAETGEESFRPRLAVRQQSWNEQDLKRVMQKMALGVDGGKTQGFSEGGYENGDGSRRGT
ncbi:MAG: hypothetical protein M1813_004646 [Trichoglossum hirsutum]|nr:MAG: hypothetical protein M1813_004646 [Trichoglossum hirsutum]